jgi:FdhD protein
MIVSRSAPTSRAITLCRSLGTTLVGYVRGGTFRVYTHGERVALEAMER